MANSINVLGTSRIPGGGHSSSGVHSNDKVEVWGIMTITSFTGTGLEPLTAAEIGLATIDQINLEVELVDTASPTVASFPGAQYDFAGEQVVVLEDVQDGDAADTSATLRFIARGDSAAAPNLT
jgi:hypothetical protein